MSVLVYGFTKPANTPCTLTSDFACEGYSIVKQPDGTTTITLDLVRTQEEIGEFYVPAGWVQLRSRINESYPCQANPQVVNYGETTRLTCHAENDIGALGDTATLDMYFIYRDGQHVTPDLIRGTLQGTIREQ